jgi:hypothetical protein
MKDRTGCSDWEHCDTEGDIGLEYMIIRTTTVFLFLAACAWSSDARVAVTFDASEAQAVLDILNKRAAHSNISGSDWGVLFATEPYRRLKAREAGLHRVFTDADFQIFVASDALLQQAPVLKQTLAAWKAADLNRAAARILDYLPANAIIRAKVFPVIKPVHNSFVFEPAKDPTIFLYVDPDATAGKFENTIAHELHHIGFASVWPEVEKTLAHLSPNAKSAALWMGDFGEGLAMLAAAGGPDVHPHATSNPEDRARWDRDMANFNSDLRTLETFFFDILDGRLKTEEDKNRIGMQFFGVQGPWYTVGYKMAAMIERRFGRAKLIETMLDSRLLLAMYNQAAAEQNMRSGEKLALWSPELLKKIGVE